MTDTGGRPAATERPGTAVPGRAGKVLVDRCRYGYPSVSVGRAAVPVRAAAIFGEDTR